MSNIRAINNNIIFQFLDSFSKQDVKQFKEQTDWGFEYARINDSMDYARWVKVISVGPDVHEDIVPESVVLVKALQWTEGFKFDGQEYWKTDNDNVLAIQ